MNKKTVLHLSTASVALLALSIPAVAAPKTFVANDYGAVPSTTVLNTVAIQRAIDAAAIQKSGGIVTLKPGTYLTGSIFLKSGTTLDLPEGVTLIGSQHLADYPELPTRIAGMRWLRSPPRAPWGHSSGQGG